jgi:ElaB/YqjD/DUF883 family membrane-anchored ribosome-binding protein
MTTKIVKIEVPLSWDEPEELNKLSPEENAFILDVGCETIKDARALVAGLSQKEIYDKIREESKGEIEKLEMDLLVQKELRIKMEEALTVRYDNQLIQLKKQNQELTDKLKEVMNNSKFLVQQEVDKEKEKLEKILEDKNKQVLRITENYETFLKQTDTKSSKKLGDEGEDNFIMLSETFKDFIGYKIEKKSHQGHKGDFHLFFDRFNVLVDLKNYSGSVQKKELDKIEHDLSINDTMDFAWLISYESNVSDWNRFPIMCKWIVTDVGLKCVIIVNKLNANKNPTDVLRIVWNMTNEIFMMMSKTKEIDNTELEKIRERDYNVLQKIKMAQKRLSEMKRNVVSMSQIAKDIENDIIDAVSMFTNELSKNEFDKSLKIKEWWNENIVFNDNNESKLTSTDIWTRFKKENKLYVDENKMLVDDFKTCVKNFVDVNNYVEKSKKGSIEFIGFKFKDLLVIKESEKVKSEEKLEVELNIPNVVEKKKKIIKKKEVKVVINEFVDKDIIDQYNNTNLNVLELSKQHKLLVWQVVSILMANGIIVRRSDARGYELYKETDEYKNKLDSNS